MYSWGLLQFMWSWEGRSTVGTQSREVLGTVSRRWKFSRRSFYRGLCGLAEAAIACCRQPSLPDETPAAPQDPQVPLPSAACWCPELRPTSQTPASGSALCALCSVPDQKSEKTRTCYVDHRKCENWTLQWEAQVSSIIIFYFSHLRLYALTRWIGKKSKCRKFRIFQNADFIKK